MAQTPRVAYPSKPMVLKGSVDKFISGFDGGTSEPGQLGSDLDSHREGNHSVFSVRLLVSRSCQHVYVVFPVMTEPLESD
jgi:hypothetical protein